MSSLAITKSENLAIVPGRFQTVSLNDNDEHLHQNQLSIVYAVHSVQVRRECPKPTVK